MIQKVGFKNFRRFKNFPEMDLGDINIFVGRNNAGKSTVLKALQLMKGNLGNMSIISDPNGSKDLMKPMFVFDVDELAELHIDNFERALYNKAERKEITLSATIDGCSYTIVLDGQSIKQNNNYVAVPYNFIELRDENVHLTFDFQTRNLKAEVKKTASLEQKERIDHLMVQMEQTKASIALAESELSDINAQLKSMSDTSTSPEEMVMLVSKRQTLEMSVKARRMQLEVLENELKSQQKEVEAFFVIDIESFPEFSPYEDMNIFESIINNLRHYSSEDFKIDKRTSKYKKVEKNQQLIKICKEELKETAGLSSIAWFFFNLEYIHAHAASQKVIYLKGDKGDVLSKTIADFCKARIEPGDKEWHFIKKWMSMAKFGIGDDFRIDDIQSAGYMLKIIEDGEDMDLADKGTGSIQIMTLLFSLAVIMHKVEEKRGEYNPVILIEEPEQNIHPMLQSMLADMFLDFWQIISEYDEAQFFIETHSEYLIRRTQVIVAEEEYKDSDELLDNNPFRLFYFQSGENGVPYELHYNTDGSFDRPFDEGFFDAAGNSQLQLMKIARRKK